MNTRPIRVLCLDIEGRHGGSSRSLFQALQAIDRTGVQPRVVCRRGGWIEAAYKDLDIPCTISPAIPTLTVLKDPSRNLAVLAGFRLRDWPRSHRIRQDLLTAADNADLVHCNHISLTPLACWLRRKRPRLPITMHIRTMPVDTFFARRQAQAALRACTRFAFITENERRHFEAQANGHAPGKVIYNPVIPATDQIAPMSEIPADGRLKVACLSNYSYPRGIDRLIDIAVALQEDARSRILFVVAGDMTLSGRLPGALGLIGAAGGDLADYAARLGVSDCFCFLGHVAEPERVLAACDVLIKPTREDNPWGRDILEALGAGLAVASVGRYARFVETGVTGLLQPRFNAGGVAAWLVELEADRSQLRKLGEAGRARIAALCAPAESASALASLWREAHGGADPAVTPRRTRIVGVLPSFAAGGAERVLLSLVGGLDRERFEGELIVLDDSGPLVDRTVGLDRVQVLGRPRLRHAVTDLIRAIRLTRCDVVFASQIHLNMALLLAKGALGRVRIVVREANMPSQCLRSGHWPGWYRWAYRLALRRAALVIATSTAMAAEFRDLFHVPEARIAILPNPVDVDALRSAAQTPQRRPGPGRRFVAVGRLVRQKGFDRLIPFMEACGETDHLTIVGDGPERHTLAAAIRQSGLQERIDLAGFQGAPWPVIAGADALLLPSRWEGMPNVALEALALGTPVIATAESGAIAEVATAAPVGAVVVAENAAAFATAIVKVRPDPVAEPRAAILPPAHERGAVLQRFEELISGVVA